LAAGVWARQKNKTDFAVSQDLSRIFDKTQDRSPIVQDLRRIDCDLAFYSSEIWRSFRLRSGVTGMFNCVFLIRLRFFGFD